VLAGVVRLGRGWEGGEGMWNCRSAQQECTVVHPLRLET